MDKTCVRCREIKPITDFHVRSSSRDGRRGSCKVCECSASRGYQQRETEEATANRRASWRAYYNRNREALMSKANVRRNKSGDRYLAVAREYKVSHRTEINARNKHRYTTDEVYRMTIRFRNRTRDLLKDNGASSPESCLNLLGCSARELVEYIESKFASGMTWENQGRGVRKWELDHIRPCCSFDITDVDQRRECFHYTNLQPLWYEDHLKKTKIDARLCRESKIKPIPLDAPGQAK